MGVGDYNVYETESQKRQVLEKSPRKKRHLQGGKEIVGEKIATTNNTI